MSFRNRTLLSVGLGWLLLCHSSWADEPTAKNAETGTKFMRLTRTDKGDLASMDTAIVRYVPADDKNPGLVVDLIGVVHVGEKAYYEQLNKEFEQYDALLYELVAPEKKNVPKKGEGSGHPVALLQNGMKDVLGLEHQLSLVDYTKKNFVHADMSPEAFSKSMDERGESFMAIILRSMGHGLAQDPKSKSSGNGLGMLMSMFSNNRSLQMKRMMAEQFEDMDSQMKAIEGPNGSTIITERNKVALKVLADQIAAGKKKLGVFYGAGHLPDMEKRLNADFGLKYQDQRWLVAWDLKQPTKEKKSVQPADQKASEAKAAP